MILLDNGDNLQGTTFQYYSNHDTNQPNITAQFLNFFPYDVAGVGNHDIEAGRKVFDRVYNETKVPVVCANEELNVSRTPVREALIHLSASQVS